MLLICLSTFAVSLTNPPLTIVSPHSPRPTAAPSFGSFKRFGDLDDKKREIADTAKPPATITTAIKSRLHTLSYCKDEVAFHSSFPASEQAYQTAGHEVAVKVDEYTRGIDCKGLGKYPNWMRHYQSIHGNTPDKDVAKDYFDSAYTYFHRVYSC
ncbi:hypothetical protein L2E82_02755 [Cichorium intybus]|uniref:Uncharacterized protein n=1 Tax=Cichorium intybus TaxID=13427 RepID=A0ACB9H3P3_CICIN|nr:hypothetical protein L2E82_02755 [Cichorium intybus]